MGFIAGGIIAGAGAITGAVLAYEGQQDAADAQKQAGRETAQAMKEQRQLQRELAQQEREERAAIREAEKKEKAQLAELSKQTQLSTYQAVKVSDAAAQAFGTFANNFVTDMGINAQQNVNALAKANGTEIPNPGVNTLANFVADSRVERQTQQAKSDEKSIALLNGIVGG